MVMSMYSQLDADKLSIVDRPYALNSMGISTCQDSMIRITVFLTRQQRQVLGKAEHLTREIRSGDKILLILYISTAPPHPEAGGHP